MYYVAFRGMRVDVAQRCAAAVSFQEAYARELQEPAASRILDADAALVITASPDFMAKVGIG